jgi:uncharacterized SAM-dependent methyltransferase
LGSSIGNFHRPAACEHLRLIAATMRPHDRLLLGVDLRKDKSVLEAAYDDSAGVTAEFNLNLLARMNRELGGDFDVDRFAHRAIYREVEGRVDIYAVSRVAQRVRIADLNLDVSFDADEAIHTESSYKYSLDEIDDLATGAGFIVCETWLDPKRWFSLSMVAAASAGGARVSRR